MFDNIKRQISLWNKKLTRRQISNNVKDIMTWNPFDDKENSGTSVIGTSGSGKSVFMKNLLVNILKSNNRIIALCNKNMYKKAVAIEDTQYIEFNEESRICLNPFSNLKMDNQEDLDDQISMITSIISLIVSACKHKVNFQD